MRKRCKERLNKMAYTEPVTPTFHEGDEVVLVEGTYQGTLGTFVRLRNDVAWADIAECNGAVRSHPVAWLGHARMVNVRCCPTAVRVITRSRTREGL